MLGFKTEKEFISEAKKFFQKKGLLVYEGVPCLSRCIDLLVEDNDVFKAIEFKLHDWRRGLIQASDHLLAVDYSYVCLPQRRISQRMLNCFKGSGIGLMIYTGNEEDPFWEVLPAEKSNVKWPVAGSWLKRSLREGQHIAK
ncbi:MAG: hypothetical protein AB1556_16180 [Bacillota bacterium]